MLVFWSTIISSGQQSDHYTDEIYLKAYDSIHRFENLQKQNNTIIHRMSRVEEMLTLNTTAHVQSGSQEILNNRRTVPKAGNR